MFRFFVKKEYITGDMVTLTDENAQHILKVLRLRIGDKIIVCDGERTDYLCVINGIDKLSATAAIEKSVPNAAEPETPVVLFQSLPKLDKMDFIIQKCVELGITEIVPIVTERSIVKSGGANETKLNRWRKISESAAKQCGRGIIPKIGEITGLKDSLKYISSQRNNIVLYENERKLPLKAYFNSKAQPASNGFSVFIGPEGGFSGSEIQILECAGITPVCLGERILRTETAGMAALTIILYEYGDI